MLRSEHDQLCQDAAPKEHGRPIRLFLEHSVLCEHLIVEARSQFDQARRPARRDTPAFRSKCQSTLQVILLNLAALSFTSPSLWLQTPASRAWYAESRFWIGDGFTLAAVNACSQFLVKAGYVSAIVGNASVNLTRRRSSGIKPTEKFRALVQRFGLNVRDIWRSPSMDLIQLRGPKLADGRKPRIPFFWTDELQGLANNLTLINQRLLGTHIGLAVNDQQLSEIAAHIARKHDPELLDPSAADFGYDFTQTTLYRVFNNGSFEQGGRFYGGWWQSVPKKWRSYITINRAKIVEIDYAAMHPTALSHMLGLPAPRRFYDIGFGSKALVKATFNALINARGQSIKAVQGFDEVEVGLSWTEFLSHIKNHYAAYREFFGTGYGLRLQKLDSDIAEAVMLHFNSMGKVILPVHDSFLCPEALEPELALVMQDEFTRRTGGIINLRRKRLSHAGRSEVRATLANHARSSISDRS